LAIQVDSAAPLCRSWDAFALIKINADAPTSGDNDYLIEFDEGALMTAVTAIAIRNCIPPPEYGKVLLPSFIIANGCCVSLYVTGLNERGTPVVYMVRYPDGSHSQWRHLGFSPSDGRTKLFVALALLLHNFKSWFETTTITAKTYHQQFQNRMQSIYDLENYAPSDQFRARNDGSK
jgi:hypothetical protein